MRYIVDIDGTIFCSKHRQLTLPDGSLDLQHWIENSKPENVLKDKPLPLLEIVKRAYAKDIEIVICTARVMASADFQLLENHGLQYDAMLSRPVNSQVQDATLKEFQLRAYAEKIGHTWARFSKASIMFDDNLKIIATMKQCGIKIIDATDYNDLLTGRRKIA